MSQKKTATFLLCRCECGGIHKVAGNKLKNGYSMQCVSCQMKECGFVATHGRTETPEYHVWATMRQRCLNKKNRKYKSYGGRGISICERWDKFENFLEDMGDRPDNSYVLDRLDVDGCYTPENCKWVTQSESANNRRCSKKYKDKYITGTFEKSLFCECCLEKVLQKN